MASSYTTRARFTLQATGENNNTWGVILNSGVFQLVDDSIAGTIAFALSGTHALTTANGATDEARFAVVNITGGTGGSVTIPAVSKLYTVRNASSGQVQVGVNAGPMAMFQPGEVGHCYCDGATTYRVRATDFGGATLTGLGVPINPTDACTRGYADNLAFNAIGLPGQPGNAGNYLKTDGTNAAWTQVSGADLAPASVNTAQLANGAVTNAKIGASQITTTNMVDGAITNPKIGPVAVDHTKYGDTVLWLSAANATARALQFFTGAQPVPAAGLRWNFGANAASETGANVGSDLAIDRFSDTGGYLGSPLVINRNSGAVTMPNAVSVGSLNVSGGVGITGALSVGGNVTSNAMLRSTAPNQTGKGLQILTNNVLRWQVIAGADNETGSGNNGSTFYVQRFDDGGNYLDSPVQILRTSGQTYLTSLSVSGGCGLSAGATSSAAITLIGANSSAIVYNPSGVLRFQTVWDPSYGYTGYAYNSSGAFIGTTFRTDVASGLLYIPLTGNNTTGAAANVSIRASDGLLFTSSSSVRYKRDLLDYEPPVGVIDLMRPISYRELEAGEQSYGGDRLYVGFTAEDLDALGLTEFVDYDAEGLPNGIFYANLTALLVRELQDVRQRLNDLENPGHAHGSARRRA
jgi:hypothetical protein